MDERNTIKTNASLPIDVIAATAEQEPVLANLIELYAHDFSEFRHFDIGEDGRFGYASLSLYWSDPDRYPFLIRVDGKLAGLALVTRIGSVWDMAEFFILRGWRRHGVGSRAAREVWKRFPGAWEVRVMDANLPALEFWTRAIALRPVLVERPDGCWNVFSFDSLV